MRVYVGDGGGYVEYESYIDYESYTGYESLCAVMRVYVDYESLCAAMRVYVRGPPYTTAPPCNAWGNAPVDDS